MGSKGLNGKTAAWCIFRNEVNSGFGRRDGGKCTEVGKAKPLENLVLAISVGFCKEEVGVTVFSQLSV